jgi:hypothetical protein
MNMKRTESAAAGGAVCRLAESHPRTGSEAINAALRNRGDSKKRRNENVEKCKSEAQCPGCRRIGQPGH